MQTQIFLIMCTVSITYVLSCSKLVKYEKLGCKDVVILSVPNDFSRVYELEINVSIAYTPNKEYEPMALINNLDKINNREVRDLTYSVEFPDCTTKIIRVTSAVFNGKIICEENLPSNETNQAQTIQLHHTSDIHSQNTTLRRNKRQSRQQSSRENFSESGFRRDASYSPRSTSVRQSVSRSVYNDLRPNGFTRSSRTGIRERAPDAITRSRDSRNSGFRESSNISRAGERSSRNGFRETPSVSGFRDTNGFRETNGFRGTNGFRERNTNGFRGSNFGEDSNDTENNGGTSGDNSDCGYISNNYLNLINGGELAVKGDFPWTVAIFLKTGSRADSTYICTGNQISNKHVITAGHCTNIEKHRMFIIPGLIHLDDVISETIYEIRAVHKHPKYEGRLPNHDVAIMVVDKKMPGMPVCLWPIIDVRTSAFVGSRGVVLGWGRYHKDKAEASEWLKMIELPIVSQETCIFSDERFRNLVAENTFCAGDRDMTGPCSGDSGGGFNMKIDGRFYLRGIVSTAISKNKTCDLSNYVIFTDVAKHMTWVNRILNL